MLLVLHLDDNQAILKLYKANLGSYCNIIGVKSTAEAMDMISDLGSKIDILLLDNHLTHHHEGVDFAIKLRKEGYTFRIVLLSAHLKLDNTITNSYHIANIEDHFEIEKGNGENLESSLEKIKIVLDKVAKEKGIYQELVYEGEFTSANPSSLYKRVRLFPRQHKLEILIDNRIDDDKILTPQFTKTQFGILLGLIENSKKVFPINEIVELKPDPKKDMEEQTAYRHISNINKILEENEVSELLKNIKGVGYTVPVDFKRIFI